MYKLSTVILFLSLFLAACTGTSDISGFEQLPVSTNAPADSICLSPDCLSAATFTPTAYPTFASTPNVEGLLKYIGAIPTYNAAPMQTADERNRTIQETQNASNEKHWSTQDALALMEAQREQARQDAANMLMLTTTAQPLEQTRTSDRATSTVSSANFQVTQTAQNQGAQATTIALNGISAQMTSGAVDATKTVYAANVNAATGLPLTETAQYLDQEAERKSWERGQANLGFINGLFWFVGVILALAVVAFAVIALIYTARIGEQIRQEKEAKALAAMNDASIRSHGKQIIHAPANGDIEILEMPDKSDFTAPTDLSHIPPVNHFNTLAEPSGLLGDAIGLVRTSWLKDRNSNVILSDSKSGMSASAWSRIVHALADAGLVDIIPDRGTFVSEGQFGEDDTLDNLLKLLRSGKVQLNPPTPPTSAAIFAVGTGQNGGNGHRNG